VENELGVVGGAMLSPVEPAVHEERTTTMLGTRDEVLQMTVSLETSMSLA
jgi:hypothetical protein